MRYGNNHAVIGQKGIPECHPNNNVQPERTEEDNSDDYMLDFTWLGLTGCRRSAYPRVRLGRGDLNLYAYCNFWYCCILSHILCLFNFFLFLLLLLYMAIYEYGYMGIHMYIGILVGSRGSQSGLADDGSVVTTVTVFYRPRILWRRSIVYR